MVRTQAPLVERMTLVWHDWFATSKSGVPQRLMLRQNALLRRHALGNFEQLALDITQATRRCCCGSTARRTTAWDVNENYARELQELFCLGAGRGYSERDVRQLARALTGFRNDWTDAGPTRFRYDAQVPRPEREAHLRQARQVTAGRRACGWSRATAATPSSWSRSSGATSSRPSRARRRSKALAQLYVAQRPRGPPAAGGDPRATPTSTTRGKRMVKPPVVQAAGMLRAVGRGIDTQRLGVAVRERRPVPVHAAQRLRLGRHALAGHRHLPRALADGPARSASRRGSIPRRATDVPADPGRAGRAAPSAFWGSPGAVRARARRARALRRRHAGRRRRALEARRATPCWRSTRCGCSSPPPPTT